MIKTDREDKAEAGEEMEKKGRQQYLVLLTAAASYMQLCAGYAVVWAGFNGFGGIWLEYTEEGEKAAGIILFLPLLLLLLLLALLLMGRYRQKAPVKYYVYDVCGWLLGIGVGIALFFLFVKPREAVMNGIVRLIRGAGWLQCPAP